MFTIINKYYLKFPPLARKVIDFSILSFMNGIMVDYYHSNVENVLMDFDHKIKLKNK